MMFHLMWIFNGTDPPGRTFSAFIYDTDMHGYVNHISMKIWHFHQKFLQNTNQPLLSIDIYQYLTVAEICVPQEFAHIIWFFTLGGKSPVIVGVPKTWVSYDLMKRPGSSGSNGEPWVPRAEGAHGPGLGAGPDLHLLYGLELYFLHEKMEVIVFTLWSKCVSSWWNL